MALIQIPVQTHDGYPTAAFAADHIVGLRASPTFAAHTEIRFNSRDAQGQVVTLTSPVGLGVLIGLFGPFEIIDVLSSDIGPHQYHVRANAVAAVQPMANDNGHVWLVNNEALYVSAGALAALAALLVGTVPPGPVPNKI